MLSAIAGRSCALLTFQHGADGTFLLSTLSQQPAGRSREATKSVNVSGGQEPLCARFWYGA